MLWASDVLHGESQAGHEPFDGLKQKYINGGQNAGAKVHIAGVAGGKLVGDAQLKPWEWPSGQTGNQRVEAQFEEDRTQLNEGMIFKQAGYITLSNPYDPTKGVITGVKPTTLVEDWIAEKQSELEDDDAGVTVGNLLGQVFAGNVKGPAARSWIFSLLCDK
jgi:hypothetical protein